MIGEPRPKDPIVVEDIPRIDPASINKDLMRKVRTFINGIGTGYPDPASDDESELLYFASLFESDEQAERYLLLKNDWQTIGDFCAEHGLDPEVVEHDLEHLCRVGAMYKERDGADKPWLYRPLPFAHGLMEHGYMLYKTGVTPYFRLPLIAPAQKSGRYARQFMMPDDPFVRVIPVDEDVVGRGGVLDTDHALKLLRQHERFAVGRCVCRGSNPAPCSHTDECCIGTDAMADFYLEMGMARETTYEELEQLFLATKENGSFIQAFSSTDAEVFCVCCGCPGGCAEVKFAKAFPNGEAFDHYANYYVYVEDIDACVGCGTCESGCPMGNIKVSDGKTTIANHACVGCGVCVNVCPNDVVKLAQKDDPYVPRKTMWDLFALEEETREGRTLGF